MSDERNIKVGKSWPRPTTDCDLIPRWEGEFKDFDDWVSFASQRLCVATDSNGHDLKAICVDTKGRRCANGRDFATARDEGTFPVRYFWDCWPDNKLSMNEQEMRALMTQLNEMRRTANPFVVDWADRIQNALEEAAAQ